MRGGSGREGDGCFRGDGGGGDDFLRDVRCGEDAPAVGVLAGPGRGGVWV